MKPFNLERALAGDPVVTRSGEPVVGIHVFPEVNYKTVYAVVAGVVYSFTLDGIFLVDPGSPYDLFMAPKKVTGWIVISKYRGTGKHYISCHVYSTKEEASKHAHSTIIDIIPIEFEDNNV